MKQSSSFVRKSVYLGLIGILLIPISLISQPASRNGETGGVQPGGLISQMRQNYSLSQSQLSDIDPTSETMKLATLGLRGVAVNLLWMQANEQKKKEQWDNFETTLNALIKIQPNFVKVWEFQAHNLSYNISVEFDDYEYRYSWVRKGIDFLAEGIKYNLREHKILDSLGDFTGMKIGNADEKSQFRRLFRADQDFHSRMAKHVEPNLYDHPVYGHDHWHMAYWWFDKSENLVQNQGVTKRTNDLVYYMKRPSQIRHQAMALENEFRTEDNIREVWRNAQTKWKEYGDRRIVTSLGNEITLNGLALAYQERTKLREKIDSLAPTVREEEMRGVYERLKFTADDIKVQQMPIDLIGEFEMPRYRNLNEAVEAENERVDQLIYDRLDSESKIAARAVLEDLKDCNSQLRMTDRYQGTANYLYWVDRCAVEQEEAGMLARQAWYDADETRRKSVFDDEIMFDYRTGTETVTRQGAISAMTDVFAKYEVLFDKYIMLKNGDLAETLIDSAKEFLEMLEISGREWPSDFPIQALIDLRKRSGDNDELPVSPALQEELNQRRAANPGPDPGAPPKQLREVKPERDSGSGVDGGGERSNRE